jgi:molybdenum cofactor synthesis domain-containing protein
MADFTALVVTLSDRASQGIYEDKSGEVIVDALNNYFKSTSSEIDIGKAIIPDDEMTLRSLLEKHIALKTDFIITTGGTGIGSRDITPEVVKPLLTKEIPGIMEVIRVKYGLQFASAALSRSIAGVADKSLIYCLPGSPKAVGEYMDEILKTLLHCHKMIQGNDDHRNG